MGFTINESDSFLSELDVEFKQEYDRSGQIAGLGKNNVCYLEPDESEGCIVQFNKNKLGIYVLAPTGELFMPENIRISKYGRGVIRHSSFNHSYNPESTKNVVCAGKMEINDNRKISYINNTSGHFKPKAINLYIAVKVLENHLDENAKVKIFMGRDENNKAVSETMKASDFISNFENQLKETSSEFQKSVADFIWLVEFARRKEETDITASENRKRVRAENGSPESRKRPTLHSSKSMTKEFVDSINGITTDINRKRVRAEHYYSESRKRPNSNAGKSFLDRINNGEQLKDVERLRQFHLA